MKTALYAGLLVLLAVAATGPTAEAHQNHCDLIDDGQVGGAYVFACGFVHDHCEFELGELCPWPAIT